MQFVVTRLAQLGAPGSSFSEPGTSTAWLHLCACVRGSESLAAGYFTQFALFRFSGLNQEFETSQQ